MSDDNVVELPKHKVKIKRVIWYSGDGWGLPGIYAYIDVNGDTQHIQLTYCTKEEAEEALCD